MCVIDGELHGVRIVILRSNPIAPDPRVEKEAQTLAKRGYQVEVVGWDRTASFPAEEKRDFGTIHRISFRAHFGKGMKNLWYLLRWQVLLFWWLWRYHKRFDVIHACDFDTVLPALLISRLFHKKLVYDIFDFYADMLRNVPAWIKKLTRKFDLWVINKVDAVILADASRKEQIKGSHPRLVEIIFNSPKNDDSFHVQGNAQVGYRLRIAYVGLLQRERGLLEMLKVVSLHPEWQLDLAGFGDDEVTLASFASELKNVVFHGRLPYDQALRLMAEADVLFATYDPRIPNHRYSSPNKVFEAMMLGKPVIVARGMGIDNLVEQYNLGFVVEYGDIAGLEKTLATVAEWTESQKRDFAVHAQKVFAKYFAWQKMEERLIGLYCRLFSDSDGKKRTRRIP